MKSAASSGYAEGQAWTYKTRPGEEDSIVVIGKIETRDGLEVIHVQIQGVALPNLVTGDIQTVIGEVPMSRAYLELSLVARTTGELDTAVFDENYRNWEEAGPGGVFTLTLADVMNLYDRP